MRVTDRPESDHVGEPDARWDDALGATVGPGDWLLLEVIDSGCGMDEATRSRVFEPFFTTKESGKGSGLGLAMVHGFAEQSGGIATIDSQVGRGTTVRILLPRCLECRLALGHLESHPGPFD